MNYFEVLAHGGEQVIEKLTPAADQIIRSSSIKFTISALILLGILTFLSILNKNEKIKYLLFGLLVVIILANTIYLSGSTIYLNQISLTKGPVHYHADFEIWNCGKKVDIADPKGLSNKVGTEVVHEHNDDRIHIEGVILDKHQASLGHFFDVVGGPSLESEMRCLGEFVKPQVFVYKTDGSSFSQQKLVSNPQDYVISPYGQVPPGDCIIIEFGPQKEKTDKLCNFYKVAVEKGELVEK